MLQVPVLETKIGKKMISETAIFLHFIRMALLVAAARSLGAIARFVLNLTIWPHKPQSKQQLERTKERRAKQRKGLKKDNVMVDCFAEIYFQQEWIPIVRALIF